MGTRNPDRVPIRYFRARCESVADMRREGWDVVSKCEKCGLMMGVDLALIIKVNGPNVSLWNRRAICRRMGCRGSVEFMAKAPGMVVHQPLAAPDE
jgi:hypothetical protein